MSSSVARAKQLFQRRQAKDAVTLLSQAAAEGDAQSAAYLGDLRLSGHLIRRDLAEARNWFGRAADLGLEEAEPIFVALLANGAGGSGRRWQDAVHRLRASAVRDPWAAWQLDLIAAMSITQQGDPVALPPRVVLRANPRLETISGLLSAEECRYLIERAESLMQPAMVVDPRTGKLIHDPIRSASSASFPFVTEDPAMHGINRRIAMATGTTYEQGEPLQVLRYRRAEQYRLHSDALPLGGEQRATTVLIALGSDFDGGETTFPRLALSWRGQTGDALIFDNINQHKEPDQRMWHAGMPVISGIKHLASKWIRCVPLDLSGPKGHPI